MLNFHEDTLRTGRKSPPEPLREIGTGHLIFRFSTIRDNHSFFAPVENGGTIDLWLVRDRVPEDAECQNYLIQFRIKRSSELAETFANLGTRPCGESESERGLRFCFHKAG